MLALLVVEGLRSVAASAAGDGSFRRTVAVREAQERLGDALTRATEAAGDRRDIENTAVDLAVGVIASIIRTFARSLTAAVAAAATLTRRVGKNVRATVGCAI